MERFWKKVEKTDYCWIWTGSKNRLGYGRFVFNKQIVPAYKVAWILTYGLIPKLKGAKKALSICHRCDNPACVRPDHLFIGTDKDNFQDMVDKKRNARGSLVNTSKLTEDQVKMIRAEYPKIKSTRKLAIKYAVSRTAIRYILNRRNWKHI